MEQVDRERKEDLHAVEEVRSTMLAVECLWHGWSATMDYGGGVSLP